MVLAIAFMKHSKRLVAASADRKISFFEVTNGQKFSTQTISKIENLDAIPLCLEYHQWTTNSYVTVNDSDDKKDEKNQNKLKLETLLVGDDLGMVVKYDFTETDWHYCYYDMNSSASKHNYLKAGKKDKDGNRTDNIISGSSYCHNAQIEKEYSLKIEEAFKTVVSEKKKRAEEMKIKDPKHSKGELDQDEERDKVAEKKVKVKPVEMGKVVKGVYEKRRWIHKGWITKIKYYSDLNYVVSSSLDGFIHIHDIETISYKAKTFNLH